MLLRPVLWTAIAILLATASCQSPKMRVPAHYKTRFEAASDVLMISDRDEAYAAIAKDALANGDHQVARIAIAEISMRLHRDRIAKTCALEALSGGASEAAKRYADMILMANERDEVNVQIAKTARREAQGS